MKLFESAKIQELERRLEKAQSFLAEAYRERQRAGKFPCPAVPHLGSHVKENGELIYDQEIASDPNFLRCNGCGSRDPRNKMCSNLRTFMRYAEELRELTNSKEV